MIYQRRRRAIRAMRRRELTFADSLLGRDLQAILHSMQCEVDLGDRLLVDDGAQGCVLHYCDGRGMKRGDEKW